MLSYHLASDSKQHRHDGTKILVGESDAARALGYRHDALAEQEYVIKTFPHNLLLMGHDGQDFSTVRYEDYGSLYTAALGPIGTGCV